MTIALPSSESCNLPSNFRQTWLQKLSNKGLPRPCTQLTSRTSVRCSVPSILHPKTHLRAGGCVSSEPTSEVCTGIDTFFRRAERDHLFCFAQTRRGGVRKSGSSETSWYDVPSIDWKTAITDTRECAEPGRENRWWKVLCDGCIDRKAIFCIRDTFCRYWLANMKPTNDCELTSANRTSPKDHDGPSSNLTSYKLCNSVIVNLKSKNKYDRIARDWRKLTEWFCNSATISKSEDIFPSIEVYHLNQNSTAIERSIDLFLQAPCPKFDTFKYHPTYKSGFTTRSQHFDVCTCANLYA